MAATTAVVAATAVVVKTVLLRELSLSREPQKAALSGTEWVRGGPEGMLAGMGIGAVAGLAEHVAACDGHHGHHG